MDQATVQTPPAGRRRGFIFWILVIVSVPIVLFVGSAVIAGLWTPTNGLTRRRKPNR